MFGSPRSLVAAIAFVGFVASTLIGAAYEYPLALAAACGALGVGWALLLNLRPNGSYLLRLLLIVPLAVGVAVIAGSATEEGRSAAAPFLALALTTAVHVAVLMGVRRFGRSGE